MFWVTCNCSVATEDENLCAACYSASARPSTRLHDGRVPLAEAGRLLERVRHLQDAEVFFIATDDLQPNGKPFRCKARWHRGCRIARCRNVPARLHPVDVV